MNPSSTYANNLEQSVHNYTGAADNARNQITSQLDMPGQINGINSARRTLLNTQNALNTLPYDVNQRLSSSGAPVTMAQRNRVLGAEQQPLSFQEGTQANALNAANSGLDTAQNYLDKTLSGFNTEFQPQFNMWSNLGNQSFTGEQNAANRQNALNVAVAPMNSQRQFYQSIGNDPMLQRIFGMGSPLSTNTSMNTSMPTSGSAPINTFGGASMGGGGLAGGSNPFGNTNSFLNYSLSGVPGLSAVR